MNKLIFSTVFVDIDGTLIDSKPQMRETDKVDPFVRLVADANKVLPATASEMITSCVAKAGNLVNQYFPYGILDKLGVTEEQLWQIFFCEFRERLFMYHDAKKFMIGLKQRYPDIKIFTATTNPQLVIYAKLAIADMANQYGSPWLDGAFGGEEVYLGGKLSPEFYTSLLSRTGAQPETTLMVGDHPVFDLEYARAAGIEQVVLARRQQPQDWIKENDGGIYVKRLDLILDRMS